VNNSDRRPDPGIGNAECFVATDGDPSATATADA
jgi:hypothetical protein